VAQPRLRDARQDHDGSLDRDNVRPATIDLRTSIYRDAHAIIEAEYDKELRVEEVAHRVASSRRQLQRAFAEIGDTSFVRDLASVRAERGAELLATVPVSVREVAHRVGYSQAAHFAKVFRTHHGVTPSTFRRQLRGKPGASTSADGAAAGATLP
jgi:AraC family transcriptional regulator of adaptative response / methylphosphotriester-DNA alkyltransferase methyltransferase